jgi:amino acid transporter
VTASPEGQLKRNRLNIWEAFALSVGIMAPTAAMALNGVFPASLVGTAVTLSFVLAAVVVLLTSYSFIAFTGEFRHAGSVYAYNGRALGPHAGFISGWLLFLTYLAFTAASSAEVGNFAAAALAAAGGPTGQYTWVPFTVAAVALVWLFAYRDVRLSTRLTLALEGTSVVLIAILTAIILGKVGGSPSGLSATPFSPGPAGIGAVAFAAVFGFLSFAGFEGASTLGEETRDPRRNIPRAILIAVVFCSVFYIIVIYAQSVGFGLDAAGIKAFSTSSAPLGDLSAKFIGSGYGVLIDVGATVSAFASALGTANGGSRLLYAMGRDGLFTTRFGRAHPRHGSPYVALLAVMLVAIGAVAVTAIQVTSANIFGYYGTIGVLSLLLAYLLTNLGAIVYFTRSGKWRGQQVIPALAGVAMLYVLFNNVYPIPALPYSLFPYLVLAWIVAGLVILFSRPELAKRIAANLIADEGLQEPSKV